MKWKTCFLLLNVILQVEAASISKKKLGNETDIPEVLRDHFEYAASEEARKDREPRLKSVKKRAVPPVVAEKAIEIGAKMAEKTAEKLFEKIGESGERANDYIENGASVDVQPQNGFATEDLLSPPALHIEAGAKPAAPENKEEEKSVVYPAGIGAVMMNGCWGSGYKLGDPCHKARRPSGSVCKNMMEAAAFVGTGFDGRGDYTPESRKMSIIQRNCLAMSTFHGEDVPDTMNVHGIYDTRSVQSTYASREEYSKQVQTEAGVSGSYFFLSAGVTAAYGTSTTRSNQMFLSVMNIDVIRYEVFKDEVKANDLSVNFVKEFMELPNSYFEPRAAFKFQDFILRWGTHYIKSVVVGGRLQLRKSSQASFYSTVEEFSVEAKVDYDAFFASFHAKASAKGGEAFTKQTKYGSMSIEAQGGDQEIAALVSDGGTPTTRTDMVNWLRSIPQYPKPVEFHVAPITELLYFQPADLFTNDDTDWDCNTKTLQDETDPITNKVRRYYYTEKTVGGKTVQEKTYCDYATKDIFMTQLRQKRSALEQAVMVYMTEGLVPEDELSVQAGSQNCGLEETIADSIKTNSDVLSWSYLISGKSFTIIFQMEDDLVEGRLGTEIRKDLAVQMHFYAKHWFVEGSTGSTSLADGFANGGSDETSNHKVSVYGLVLTFDESANMFTLLDEDYTESIHFWPKLFDDLKGRYVARVSEPLSSMDEPSIQAVTKQKLFNFPCNVYWSNLQAFDINDDGMCLFFGGISESSIYVVLAAVPNDKRTWYFVDIDPAKTILYKHKQMLTQTEDRNARGLGDKILQHGYFVCLSKVSSSTLIEYGKFFGDERERVTYLSYKDTVAPLDPAFYAYGSHESDVTIQEAHLTNHLVTNKCGSGTKLVNDVCELDCHSECLAPFGCLIAETGDPQATQCNKCKNVASTNLGGGLICTATCDITEITQDGIRICPCKWFDNRCVETCPEQSTLNSATNECVRLCNDPGQVENGQRTGTDFSDGKSVTYTCNANKIMVGEPTLTCIRSVWTYDKPQCVTPADACTPPQNVGFATRTGDAHMNGDSVTYTCEIGYLLIGSATLNCVNGNWDNPPPYCQQTWREDAKCGTDQHSNEPLKLHDGSPVGCSPYSSLICCSGTFCGTLHAYCFCADCIDYRHKYGYKYWRDDRTCGENNEVERPGVGKTVAGCDAASAHYCCKNKECVADTACDCVGCLDFRKIYGQNL